MYLSVGPANNLGFNEGFQFYEDFDCFMSERTVKFQVFRLDEDAGQWIEMTNLGDKMLFLGDNCTFSASASEIFGDNSSSRGNCILFTDQYSHREDDDVSKNRSIGVFEMESESIGPIGRKFSEMFWPPPEWVCPTASIEWLADYPV
ncbi:hypothetical protein ACS0TY_021450 [Phlomoides rotata]